MNALMSFTARPDTRHVVYDREGRDRPFFDLTSENVTVSIGPAHNMTPAEALAFARELAATTAAFLAATEAYAGTTRTPLDTVADPS